MWIIKLLKERVNRDTVIFLFLFFTCLAILLRLESFLGERLPGIESRLDPSTFPIITLTSMAALSLLVCITSVMRSEKTAKTSRGPSIRPEKTEKLERSTVPIKEFLVKAGGTMVSFIVYISLLDLLGYILSTALFVGFISFLYGNRDWRRLALVVVLFPPAVYIFFYKMLHLSLPEGFLEMYFF